MKVPEKVGILIKKLFETLIRSSISKGLRWNNIFSPVTPDDSLSLGLVMTMLLADTFIYLLIALYVEAILPGDYGVAQVWYFPFSRAFWCGEPQYIGMLCLIKI